MMEDKLQALSEVLAMLGIRAVAREAGDVKEAWDLAFGEAVPDRETVFYDEFRWHLFSYGKLPAKSGDEARAAMEARHPQRLQLFWQEGDDAWELRNAFDLTADATDRIAELTDKDLFLFDDEGCWTYVIPHEPGLGPWYFQW